MYKRQVKESQELSENLSVAAHLIHGSSDGRFKITYAVQHLSEEEIKGVYFDLSLIHIFGNCGCAHAPVSGGFRRSFALGH